MRPDELSRRLKLDEIARDHIWKVEPSCATSGEGIFEGLVRVAVRWANESDTDSLLLRHGWAKMLRCHQNEPNPPDHHRECHAHALIFLGYGRATGQQVRGPTLLKRLGSTTSRPS
jgi:hypothetical protein